MGDSEEQDKAINLSFTEAAAPSPDTYLMNLKKPFHLHLFDPQYTRNAHRHPMKCHQNTVPFQLGFI